VHTFLQRPHGAGAALLRTDSMKTFCILAIIALFAVSAFSQDVSLKDEKDKISYSIGLDIGSTFKKQGIELNNEPFQAGLRDGLAGNKPQMSEEEMKNTLNAYSKNMMEKQASKSKEDAAKNLAAGEKFLAENKTKEGIKTTPSGLQYKVIKEGTGPTPKETDTVITDYRGTLLNGTEFDSSYKRGEPATFPVNRVIKGWTEALQMMKVGSKYQLFIPANLAYGERGAGGDIGPNETLIFEVELRDIKKADAPPSGASPAAASPTKADAKEGKKDG
jgi:FKBP-type peptidyl-prolyl cis-trans isomerase FklB